MSLRSRFDGKLWSSEELAAELDRLGPYGTSHVAFLIGGSHGLSDEVMLLVLTEQIYRVVKINRGEPYHK
ncbi:23S rRNA (pseudouridine(1915)-N(3))-methyltransferase RlmH [Paenibacillus glacialis]|uniref:23S rRNA (pseudouridine(1915)-N(3))-methyltransferase RlmH n=1 Tax=Paenibacillus glacialis TaxID=494026 RepID=UPI000A9B5AA8|nr:23S rRNA (pseudouridine(1915)-N(3))-methyltransferase RlmH [Paenibacillus glacialis]